MVLSEKEKKIFPFKKSVLNKLFKETHIFPLVFYYWFCYILTNLADKEYPCNHWDCSGYRFFAAQEDKDVFVIGDAAYVRTVFEKLPLMEKIGMGFDPEPNIFDVWFTARSDPDYAIFLKAEFIKMFQLDKILDEEEMWFLNKKEG